jgi:multiple sugar transport system substrate-binding protein
MLLLVLIAVFPFFAGCGRQQTSRSSAGAASGPVTITFTNWVSTEEGTQPGIIALIDAFQKENPNITVVNQGIAVSDIVQQLIIMTSAGNPPDVSQLNSDNTGQLQAAGYLVPVDTILSPAFVADIYKDVWDATALIDGKHYACPWTIVSNGLFYNKKLMAQAGLDPNRPPKTLDELTQMMRQAKQRLPDDVIMLQADTTVRTIGLFHAWPFMLSFNNGVPPYDLDGKVNYNTPGMKAYMEWIRMLINEKLTLPGMRYGQFRPYATQNKLLFGLDGSYFDGLVRALDDTKTLTPQIFYETWGVTAPPAGRDGKYRTPAQTHSLVIFEKPANKDESAKFIEYLVSSQNALTNYFAPNSFAPVIKSALDRTPELGKSEILKAFLADVVPASVVNPTGPDYGLYAEIIMTGVQEVTTTNRSIDDILVKKKKKLEELFK